MEATFKLVAPGVLLRHAAIVIATVCIPVIFCTCHVGVTFFLFQTIGGLRTSVFAKTLTGLLLKAGNPPLPSKY